jgi:hypothetical protein
MKTPIMRNSDISGLAQFFNYKMANKRMLSDWFSAALQTNQPKMLALAHRVPRFDTNRDD